MLVHDLFGNPEKRVVYSIMSNTMYQTNDDFFGKIN